MAKNRIPGRIRSFNHGKPEKSEVQMKRVW